MNTPPDYMPPNRGEKSHRLISVHTLIDAFCTSAERFPITLAYLLVFAVWGGIDCWVNGSSESFYIKNLRPALWFLTTTGMLLSLAVSLWCEQSCKRQYHKFAQSIANLLLWIDFIYIVWRINSFSNSEYIAHLALITSLIVAIIFVPAIKRAPRRHNLMFSFIQVGNVMVSVGIAIILAIAIAIIYSTIGALFKIWSFELLASTELLFSASLSILIFISRIPTFDETVELVKNYEAHKFVVGIVKYMLLPLTAIYTIVLYVYGFKIILGGELPNGVICPMVTVLTAAVYMLLFMLKALSSTQGSEDHLTKVSLRVFPIALIPLLVMMSVAIGERIGQYGFTVDRLYVVTFNIWAYATAIYLFVTRSRRINIVAISFAITFLVTSIIPGLNYTSMVQNHMRSVVIKALKNVGVNDSEFPMSHKRFEEAKDKMDESTWIDVKSKMLYLDEHDNHSLIDDIVDFEIKKDYYIYDPLFVDKEYLTTPTVFTELQFGETGGYVEIPAGHIMVKYISNYQYNQNVDSCNILYFKLFDEVEIPLHMDSLRTLNPDTVNAPIKYDIGHTHASDSIYIVSSIEYSISEDEFTQNGNINRITVKGYLFTRQ